MEFLNPSNPGSFYSDHLLHLLTYQNFKLEKALFSSNGQNPLINGEGADILSR